MHGWIKLHRKILSSPMYKQLNSKQRDIMLVIMLLASHESNEWEFNGVMYIVEPGQFVTSIETIQGYCASDVSTQNIRTTLAKLERHRFLSNESTNRNRLITVVNWATYQAIEEEENQQATNKLTNKQSTSKSTSKKNAVSQTGQVIAELDVDELTSKLNQNQQTLVDETNNYQEVRSKEDKNIKIKYASNVKLLEKEYQTLCEEFGEEIAKASIEFLSLYKLEKDYVTKSDYLTIRRWVIKAVMKDMNSSSKPSPKKSKVNDNADFFLQGLEVDKNDKGRIEVNPNEGIITLPKSST